MLKSVASTTPSCGAETRVVMVVVREGTGRRLATAWFTGVWPAA